MAFKTDGSSHHDGIKEEKKITSNKELLKEIYSLSDNFVATHKGGTQNKADLIIKDGKRTIEVSIKKKKDLTKGSHDYVNSSKALSSSVFTSVKDTASRISSSSLSKATARKQFTNACYDCLQKMTSQHIKDILTEHVLEKNQNIEVLLSETSTGSIYSYKFKDTPLAKSIKEHTPKFKWGRGKTSAKIVFIDKKGTVHDHNLRGRLVSNNGIGAMLGLSDANSSSVPVFKVQQDRVDKVVDTLVLKNIAKKWR